MTSIEREIIKQWWFNKITDAEFKKKNKEIENKEEIIGYIIKNIEKFISQKKEEEIDEFITLIYDLELYNEDFTDILCKLSKEEWHYSHEDIAFLFELIASPKTIGCIYELSLLHQFEGYEGSFAMARKCTYALGRINTPKAKEKLLLLTQNKHKEIREYALKQLKRNDFTNKDVEN